MFAAALDVGRRVHLGLSEGVTQYYLSLPISLESLALAHILSAGLGGLIYSGILLLVALAIVPKLISFSTLIMIPFMFLVSMGLGGIAAIINLFSGGGDRFWAFAEGIQMIFLGMSTVFYPISVIQSFFPSYVMQIILLNPLSQITNALRSAILPVPTITLFSLGQIAVTSFLMLAMGFLCYRYVFIKVKNQGKI